MKILYEFSEVKAIHGLFGDTTQDMRDKLASIYNVNKKTIQNWERNDRVPEKYMRMNTYGPQSNKSLARTN